MSVRDVIAAAIWLYEREIAGAPLPHPSWETFKENDPETAMVYETHAASVDAALRAAGSRDMIGGIKIFTSTHVPLTERKNIARSPSRALRRWRKGIRKVTPFADVPVLQAFQMPGGAMVMHPAMLDRLRREIDALTGIHNLPPPQPHTTVAEVQEKVRMGERRIRSVLDQWHRAVRPQFGIFGNFTP